MTGGSQQLRRYRVARRAGHATDIAALMAGIGIAEARLIDADDVKNPPPADAYRPLSPEWCASCGSALCGCSDMAWAGVAA